MPIRVAEAQAIRRIIEERFGKDHAKDKRWVICGDFNDYYEKLVIRGSQFGGFTFEPVTEPYSSLHVLMAGGFCENLVERRPQLDRWTLYHNRGPQERHLCQLDYILASPLLARQNAKAVLTSSATANRTAPHFRPARRSTVTHVSAGTGLKPPITVPWP